MGFLAGLFLVIFIAGVLFSILLGLVEANGYVEDFFKTFTICFLCFFIPTLIIWLLNLYAFPGKETRYVPHTQIAASMNRTDSVDRTNLKVGESFYLQIKMKVDSNSFARRFFHDNKIPFRIEISNPELASFVVERSAGFEEYREPAFDSNRTTYFFNTLAKKPTEENADDITFINLKGESKMPGSQQIRILFDKKVSGTYSRVDSFVYR